MNKLEKILELSKAKGFESLEKECECKRNRGECETCSFYQVIGNWVCDISICAKRLLEPYEEPRRLTKRERGYCEYKRNGYIARDEDGKLIWYKKKPHRNKDICIWELNIYGNEYDELYQDTFPFIKWEDEEPYSVEELLKLDYEKE